MGLHLELTFRMDPADYSARGIVLACNIRYDAPTTERAHASPPTA
jgi:hypothetical protein